MTPHVAEVRRRAKLCAVWCVRDKRYGERCESEAAQDAHGIDRDGHGNPRDHDQCSTPPFQQRRSTAHVRQHRRTPRPLDDILAGLAAYTLISIRLSAEARQYPLERCEGEVSFERCALTVQGGRADHITRRIALNGDLSEVQRQNLMRAAGCAAYGSIANGMPITTEPTP